MILNYVNLPKVKGERGQKGNILEKTSHKEDVKSTEREEAPYKTTTKKKIEHINITVLTMIETPLNKVDRREKSMFSSHREVYNRNVDINPNLDRIYMQ